MTEFAYQDPFPLAEDKTDYRLLTKEFVTKTSFDGTAVLKVDPEGLTRLA